MKRNIKNHPKELVRGEVESGYALFLRGWQLLVCSVSSLNIITMCCELTTPAIVFGGSMYNDAINIFWPTALHLDLVICID